MIIATISIDYNQIVGTALGLLVTTVVIPWIRAHAKAAKLNAGQTLSDRLKSFCWDAAEVIAEQRMAPLADRIEKGQIKNVDNVKAELKTWGQDLKEQAITYFDQQGVDLIKEVGDEYVDKMIRAAADKASPFPGLESAKVLLQKPIRDAIIEKGVQFVKTNIHEINCKGCIPTCQGCKI
jgi:hypothetical protein